MAQLEVRERPAGGFIQGYLPVGCAMCTKGAKMVLFVTGVCHYNCFYCPISEEKRMNRAAWANERRIPADAADSEQGLEAIAEEVRLTGARGTGLTGGDPMYDPERTLRYIRFLKGEFGEKHHIHMYTQIPFDQKWLAKLHEAGLDEIRFHSPEEIWADVDAHPRYVALYKAAQDFDWEVGFEIPCIPGWEAQMAAFIEWIDANGFHYINLNEFEFSETNFAALHARGHSIRDDVTSRANGSADAAREMMKRFARRDVTVHFCSSPFKDAVQLRQRLKRRAESIALPHEIVTDDSTLLRGVIECPDPHGLAAELAEAFDIPDDLIHVRPREEIGRGAVNPDERQGAPKGVGGMATTGRTVDLPKVVREARDDAGATDEAPDPKPARDRLEVAPWVLEEIAPEVPYPCYMSEVYPTADELEVERVPLNHEGGVPEGDGGERADCD